MKTRAYEGDVCSHKYASLLNNFLRKLTQPPKRIVGRYINKGDTVIDLGCGSGFFTIPMAKMVGDKGRVYGVDLQPEMLAKLTDNIGEPKTAARIIPHNSTQHSLDLPQNIKADFLLACYMVHETPDHYSFLSQVKNHLKDGGAFLIIEPYIHVNRKKFSQIEEMALKAGFRILNRPRYKGGRSLLLGN